MSKIKLVIEIDEEMYQFLKETNLPRQSIYKTVANGTPITEGDMISREGMKKMVDGWLNMDKYYHPYSKEKTIPTDEVYDLIDNAPTVAERPKGECKTCKHYKPIMQRDIFGYSPRGDGYCDIRRMTQDGELEINVNDDFYCKYYERGDENGKS